MQIFRRKIYNQLLDWKQNRSDSALLVEGARRIGKSFTTKRNQINNNLTNGTQSQSYNQFTQ